MDLPFLPTPVSKCDTRTGAQFTVRSASSPSYSFTRRPGVRRSRGFIEEVREGTEGDEERERPGTDPDTNGTNKEEDGVSEYQDSTDGRSSVKGQPEEKKPLDHETSTELNQNGTGDKTTTESGTDRRENPALESRGRTELRRYNVSSRSKSLEWGEEVKSPARGARADMLSLCREGDVTTQLGGFNKRRTGAEAVRNWVSSTHTYSTAGQTNVDLERSPVSHLSQTLDRVSRGHSLPSRMRSQSGPSSRFTETALSLGPKGGQSIMERIKKLYGSAAVSKAEDNIKIGDVSTSATSADSFISSHRSYERGAGGTFPRRFSLGEKNSQSPMQSIRSVPWTPQRDASGSESSLSPERSRRLSGGLWQGHLQGRFTPEGGVNGEKGLVDLGTKSLDRARSRNTMAAQIRSARAAAGYTAPNTFLEEETSAALTESSGFTERGMNGKGDQGSVNDGKETNGVKGAEQKTELKSSTPYEDVFESGPIQTTPKKNLSAPASVRNKISQFEALTQRAQGLATGNLLVPRRAFSVPTQLSKGYDGVKKSRSAKAIGVWREKWEDLKEGGEVPNKPDDKGTGAGNNLLLERFLSEDGVGLERKGKGRVDVAESERKGTDSEENLSEDFLKYSKLKSSLEIPLNGGSRKAFYIDETDFAKVSSPEEASDKDMTANNPPTPLLSNSSDISTNVASSPASDDQTPTNTPLHSPVYSPTAEPEKTFPIADRHDRTSAAKSPDPDSSPPTRPLATSSHSNLHDLVSSEVTTTQQRGRKPVLDLDAWVAGLNSAIKVWNDDEDYEDDDESTQKDEDSNYDSDSGESSVTVTSNMSQSDQRSFCVSLSDLCSFAGVDYESDNDSDEWQSRGRRSASLSSDVSALSCVSVMPSEELDRLLEDVRSLGDNTLQDYDDVQVAVLHKEIGVGLGFSVAGGVDQSKPVTVHRVFHSGVASKEGSIMEGDQVLSINGTALNNYTHWEVLRVLRRAKARETGVVVLRRGGVSDVFTSSSGVQTSTPGPTQTQITDDGQHMCVSLEKNSRDLGFSLEGGVGSNLGNKPLTVQKIFHGGPVDKVCPGDEVLEIEGVSVVGMRRLEAWTLIRKLPSGPVDVVLSRPLKHLES